MRLIYIANARIPTEKAHGLQIMKMCEAFAEESTEVELVLPTRRDPKFNSVEPFKYYGVEKNFDINKIKTVDPWWLIWGPKGIYIKVQLILFSLKVRTYLSKKKIEADDILYTRDEYLLPVLQSVASSTRVIWEAHNLPRNKARYLNYWKKCHKIIAITTGLKNELVALGLDQGKILVAPDGVDLKIFSAASDPDKVKAEYGLPADHKLVMYVGHLYEWKGAQVLADAAGHLPANVSVVFVGGTPTDFSRFKEQNNSKSNIHFIKHQPPSKIPGILSAADVLVLPNSGRSKIGSTFTSPMKLFEYMAVKKPIVASNLESIKEILSDKNAVLVKADDSKSLLMGIEKVIKDKNLSDNISEQAYRDVQDYTWQKRAKSIFSSLLK